MESPEKLDITDDSDFHHISVEQVLNNYAKIIYLSNVQKGFWADLDEIYESYALLAEDGVIDSIEKAFRAQKLALIHSEISEALEADRADLKDDKLPQYDGLWVELADGIIRILDLCGRYRVDIGTVIKDKLEYNKSRAYKHGKSY